MEPLIADAERHAVDDYLSSGGWLTEFQHTRRFEQSIADFTGARHCVIAPNGTLALFLALAGCGIGPGDEVIVPDLTMAASATAVLLAGASVVFADIEPSTLCLDLEAVDALMTPRTKAIMFVSLNGRAPAGLATFIDRFRARGIRVIEDAAQSLGSSIAGTHLGTLGDCGCYSFSSQKIVTTGQGGAVVTSDDNLAETMRMLRDFGRKEGGSDHYLRVGWNLKFTDLQAVIGTSQMRRLPALIEQKRQLYAWYAERLHDVPGIEMTPTDLTQVTPWFVDVLVDRELRAPLMAHLRAAKIGSREFYPALHAEPAFQAPGRFPVAQRISPSGVWLPSSLRLTRADVDRVCSSIREFFRS